MTVFLLASAAPVCAAGEAGPQQEELNKAKVRIPQTAEEHRAMAESYRSKALAYEQDAETHRLMCEEYNFKGFLPLRPMNRHSMKEAQERCERYVRDASDLAENARELSKYHAARAAALGGR